MTVRMSLPILLAVAGALGLVSSHPVEGAMVTTTDSPTILYDFETGTQPDVSPQVGAALSVSDIGTEAGSISIFPWDMPPGFTGNVAYLSGTRDQVEGVPFFFTVTVQPGHTFTIQSWSVAALVFQSRIYHMQMDIDSVDAQGHHASKATKWGTFGASGGQVHLYPSEEDTLAWPISLAGDHTYYFRLQPSGNTVGYYIDDLAIYGTVMHNPEPTTLAVFGVGVAALLCGRRRVVV